MGSSVFHQPLPFHSLTSLSNSVIRDICPCFWFFRYFRPFAVTTVCLHGSDTPKACPNHLPPHQWTSITRTSVFFFFFSLELYGLLFVHASRPCARLQHSTTFGRTWVCSCYIVIKLNYSRANSPFCSLLPRAFPETAGGGVTLDMEES